MKNIIKILILLNIALSFESNFGSFYDKGNSFNLFTSMSSLSHSKEYYLVYPDKEYHTYSIQNLGIAFHTKLFKESKPLKFLGRQGWHEFIFIHNNISATSNSNLSEVNEYKEYKIPGFQIEINRHYTYPKKNRYYGVMVGFEYKSATRLLNGEDYLDEEIYGFNFSYYNFNSSLNKLSFYVGYSILFPKYINIDNNDITPIDYIYQYIVGTNLSLFHISNIIPGIQNNKNLREITKNMKIDVRYTYELYDWGYDYYNYDSKLTSTYQYLTFKVIMDL